MPLDLRPQLKLELQLSGHTSSTHKAVVSYYLLQVTLAVA
jgi:hypothetical protein